MTKRFKAPRLKIKQARLHLASLESCIAGYFGSDWYKTSFETKPDGNSELFVHVAAPPEDFGPIFGDVVHNLRAALDLLAVELVDINGGNSKSVHFPFAGNADQLDEMIRKRRFHRASEGAVEEVKKLKPYKKGNKALRALHDFDIQDKHITLIPAWTSVTSPPVSAIKENGKWVIKADLNVIPKVDFVFPDDWPLPGKKIVPTLHELASLVNGIVDRFDEISRS